MSSWTGAIGGWLAEVYLLATVILILVAVLFGRVRQPARRVLVSRWAFAALVLIGPLSASVRGARAFWRTNETASLRSQLGDRCSCSAARATVGPADRAGATVVIAFAFGSTVAAVWLGLGAIAAARLADRREAAPERIASILAQVVGPSVRPPRLVISARAAQPLALGLFRPTIVLPAWFAREEPEDRIEAALAHEWAHIRNGDLWLLALGRFLLPLLFAHPLYGWLRRRTRAEQEALADLAGSARAGPIAYAEALVRWSRAGGARGRSALVRSLGLWGGRSNELAGRIALLLDGEFRVEPRCPRRWRVGGRLAFAATIAGVGLVSMGSAAGWTLSPSNRAATARQVVSHVHALEIGPAAGRLEEPARPLSVFCCER